MNRESGTTRTHRASGLGIACLVMLVMPLGLYLTGALVAAGADGMSPAVVPAFEPSQVEQMSAWRMVAAAAMAAGAVGFLFVVPGLLGTLAFMRLPRTRPTAHAWSLAVNTAALMLICLVLRHSVGIDRAGLAAAWLAWTGVLLAVAWRSGRFWGSLDDLRRRYGGGLMVGLVAVVATIVVLFPDQFVQCFTEDGNEACELARSLRHHLLPYWELETGNRLGSVMVTPALVNSYWTCGLQTLLGNGDFGGGELATRLPYWIWWLAIFAVGYRMITPPGGYSRLAGSLLAAVPLALLTVLAAVLFSFYVGYNPYMADLGNQGVFDAMFTLYILLALDCLRHRDRWGWAISATCGLLIHYAGGVMMLLMLAAIWLCKPIERKETLRWGLLGGGMMLAVAVFYLGWGWAEGSLPYWLDTVDIEYVNDYLAAAPRWKSGPLFAAYYLIACGGIPAIALLTALRCKCPELCSPCKALSGVGQEERGERREERKPRVALLSSLFSLPSSLFVFSRSSAASSGKRWQKTVAVTTLGYLLVVLCSGYKNLHYLGPLLPVPIILFLMPNSNEQQPGGLSRTWSRRWLAASWSLIACILICWPAARPTFTLNRQLGAQTTIATDDYLTAAQWARLRYVLRQRGLMSWDCDQHTWVAYSQLDPALADPRPLVLTGGGPPSAEYWLIASAPIEGTPMTASLYARSERSARWLRSQQPLYPLDRYPRVFRPLADGPYSPHNNPLQDVRRLYWPRK